MVFLEELDLELSPKTQIPLMLPMEPGPDRYVFQNEKAFNGEFGMKADRIPSNERPTGLAKEDDPPFIQAGGVASRGEPLSPIRLE
jgi:hypothetical protein